MPALAADKLKFGFTSTLSGPNSALGDDIRDAFNLALKMKGGKLGGLPVSSAAAFFQRGLAKRRQQRRA